MNQMNLLGEEQGAPLFSQPQRSVIHLTLTGYYAGTPVCGANKAQAKANGDEFYHAMYFNDWTNARLCPHCKAEWDAAADEPSDPLFT